MRKSIFVIFAFMVACTSQTVDPKMKRSSAQFDLVDLGQSKKDVELVLGPPSEILKDDRGTWFYLNQDKTAQLGAISFDPRDEKVIGITYIPTQDDAENLEHLLKSKFSGSHFEKVRPPRCGKDYFPSEEYYFDIQKGIVIEVDSVHRAVESYGRLLPQMVSELLQKRKNCAK